MSRIVDLVNLLVRRVFVDELISRGASKKQAIRIYEAKMKLEIVYCAKCNYGNVPGCQKCAKCGHGKMKDKR